MSEKLRLDSLALRNFRCFRALVEPVTFHKSLTVFVARNGGGKSAILDAVRISVGTFTKRTSSYSQSNFRPSDASIDPCNLFKEQGAIFPISVSASGCVDGKEVKWARSLGEGGRTTTKDAHVITDYGNRLSFGIKDGKGLDTSLPILAYYGTSRLWEASDTKKDKHPPVAQSRLEGYADALTERSIFASVKSWLEYAYKVCDSKVESETDTGKRIVRQFTAVRNALDTVLSKEGWRNIHFNHTYMQMAVERPADCGDETNNRPIVVPISWTSDGVLAVFALVADIAYRCARLNPQFGEDACAMTEGIVMIDEIDLSLHPKWQQHILNDLIEVFPKIQFIVTTHSPQVISSIKRESLRILTPDGVVPFHRPTQGVEVSEILRSVFGTDSTPQNLKIVDKLNRLVGLTSNGLGDTEEWKEIYDELVSYYGDEYGPLLGVVRHKDFLKRISKERNA